MTYPQHAVIRGGCEVEHDQIDARPGDRIGARGGLFSTRQSAVSRRKPVAGRDGAAAGFSCRCPGHAAGRTGGSGPVRGRALDACEWRDSSGSRGRARWHTARGCAGHTTSGSSGRAATAAGTKVP
jgi:hypothetical protein